MAIVNWPADLPDCPQAWEETPKELRVLTEVDTGPIKSRRRFTGSILEIKVGWTLRKDQYTSFMLFWGTQLESGNNQVRFNHPYSGRSMVVTFLQPPSMRMSGKAFQVQCIWEAVL